MLALKPNTQKLLVVFAITALAALTGCPDTKSNTAATQCDAYGNCYGYGGTGGYNYSYPNQVILSGGISVVDSGQWMNALDGLLNCRLSFWNTCKYISASPRIQISINDYKLPNNSSSGGLSIGSIQVPYQNFNVTWRLIDNSTAIDAQLLLPYDRYNNPMRIKIIGKSTDSQVTVELYFGGVLVGNGYLQRVII